MEMKSPSPCPNTVTVRRNPLRRARATPSSAVPLPISLASSSPSVPSDIPAFPSHDILSIDLPQNPKPDLATLPPSPKKDSLSENLKVYLRIRPLITHHESRKNAKNGDQTSKFKNAWPKNPRSKNISKAKVKKNSEICFTVNDSHSVTLCPPLAMQDVKRIKSEVYEGFSHVFSTDSSQNEVYEKMVNPMVEDFLRGKSGMLAALGPSGSGKTHTMFGSPREPGIVPLALCRIFSQTEGSGTQSSRTFYLSMFEIYSEKGKSERMLDLSQEGGDLFMQNSTIRGLHETIINDCQQAQSLIALGMIKRATAMTDSNNQSSRSQCIINIRSGSKKVDGEVDGQLNIASLTIVDLAGAEREKRTGNQGARLLESNFINNTSMVFGLCLRSLLEHQKNPKKPFQKHFQSSLILTVKSGEDDYLDASFLLRQAAPYMKIKFNSTEEQSNSIYNKRHIQTFPRIEQLKRMKFSGLEACVVGEGKVMEGTNFTKKVVEKIPREEVKPKKVMVPYRKIIHLEADDGVPLKEDCTEFDSERKNKIMQDFSKALWNVLKEYKKNLEVAEIEIHNLRESLTNEKARSFELENELKDFKLGCSCWKEASAAVSVIEAVGFVENISPESKGYQSYDVQQVNREASSLNLKESEQIDNDTVYDTNVRGIDVAIAASVGVESLEDQCCQTCENSIKNADDGEDFCEHSNGNFEDDEDLKDLKEVDRTNTQCDTEATDLKLKGFEEIDNEQSSDGIVRSSGVVTAPCVGAENYVERCCQNYRSSTENFDGGEDSIDLEDMRQEDSCSIDKRIGSGHLDSMVSSSHLHIILSDDTSSSLQNEESKKCLDPPIIFKDDVACAYVCDVEELEKEPLPCCKPINAEKPKRRLLPASSILLRDISGLDFEDDNDKSKVSRLKKKLAADETKRTQGSISLLRLLKQSSSSVVKLL
ncbi:unnamed protein product [Ilex paraguariensis]|uniref:Kinesin-like protein n=1 Tax=Ilex paraguariensis TaxID=185542 RepID=A0ABC8RW20_9AQUA